jgi:hypothetical protein
MVTDNVGSVLKVAVTCWLALNVTTQEPVPLHPPPLQPAKDELAAAAAVRVTTVPGAKLALQVWPQLMPAGLLVTLPLPFRATLRSGEVLKLAVTEAFCVSVTLQTPAPLHAPDQPANEEFAIGDAVSATWVPLAKLALQVCPQLMPVGALVTVPVPPPLACTVS